MSKGFIGQVPLEKLEYYYHLFKKHQPLIQMHYIQVIKNYLCLYIYMEYLQLFT